jgi:hypothetical protein
LQKHFEVPILFIFVPGKPYIKFGSLSCLYALKGVGILLASLIDHNQLEVSVGATT